MNSPRLVRRIGCVLAIAAIIGCTSKSGEVTVYPLLCTESVQDESCSGKWLTLNTTVYRVSEERQRVIYWPPGISDSPRELTKCVVRNVENWKCSYPDDSADLQMEAGQFSVHVNDYMGSEVAKEHEARTRYVSWFQYWRLKLGWLLD